MTWKRLESYYLQFNYIPTTGDFTKFRCAWGFSLIHPRWPPGCANVGTWLGQLRCILGQPCVSFQVGTKASPIHQIPRDDLVGSWVERWNLIIFGWNLGWNLVVFDENCWSSKFQGISCQVFRKKRCWALQGCTFWGWYLHKLPPTTQEIIYRMIPRCFC